MSRESISATAHFAHWPIYVTKKTGHATHAKTTTRSLAYSIHLVKAATTCRKWRSNEQPEFRDKSRSLRTQRHAIFADNYCFIERSHAPAGDAHGQLPRNSSRYLNVALVTSANFGPLPRTRCSVICLDGIFLDADAMRCYVFRCRAAEEPRRQVMPGKMILLDARRLALFAIITRRPRGSHSHRITGDDAARFSPFSASLSLMFSVNYDFVFDMKEFR
jgi:hypothetical protein